MKECKIVKNKSNNEDFCSDLGREFETKENGRRTYFLKAVSREDDRARQKREKEEDQVRERAFKIAHRFAKGQLN